MTSPLNNIETFEGIGLIEQRLRRERRERNLAETTLGPKNSQEDQTLKPYFEQNLNRTRMGRCKCKFRAKCKIRIKLFF